MDTKFSPDAIPSSLADAPWPESVSSATSSKIDTRTARKQRLQKAQQHRRLHNVILAGMVLLILLLFFFINLITKDKDFSEAENRNLAQRPALTAAALADGSYFSALSDYTSDQFFGRDRWMSLKLRFETALGRKDASGVFFGKNDILFATPETPDEDALNRTISNLNQFAASHSDLSIRIMLVPDAAMMLPDQLPDHAPIRNQLQDIVEINNRLSGAIQRLDATGALTAHADEYIYYKTDHHWTSLGAYYAFTACAGQLGIADPVTDYDIYTVSDSFEGTLSSKSGSHKAKDTVQIYVPQSQIRYYVTDSDSAQRTCSIYQSSALERKDKYTVFFGGNHPKVEISTTADNQRVLLLFKDSYANSFVQFLWPYYKKIIMIDPRYYYDNLDPILTAENVTDVLLLYSADTFVTDTSLSDVLEASRQFQIPLPDTMTTP